MRGTVKGIIDGLNQILVQIDDSFPVQRGDIVELDLPKEKRSKNANSWYWKYNGELAKAMNADAEAIYRHQIRDMSVYSVLTMDQSEVERWSKQWCSKHLGRFCETKATDQAGQVTVLAYYGSSDFNKREMHRLCENLKEDLKLYDIKYDQEEINRLVAAWQG